MLISIVIRPLDSFNLGITVVQGLCVDNHRKFHEHAHGFVQLNRDVRISHRNEEHFLSLLEGNN